LLLLFYVAVIKQQIKEVTANGYEKFNVHITAKILLLLPAKDR